MKRILTALALLTLTTTFAHSMLGELRNVGKKLAPVVTRNLSLFTGAYSEMPTSLAPKFSRTFSISTDDAAVWRQKVESCLQVKLTQDKDIVARTEALNAVSAQRQLDPELYKEYTQVLLLQNNANYQLLEILNSRFSEKNAKLDNTPTGSYYGC